MHPLDVTFEREAGSLLGFSPAFLARPKSPFPYNIGNLPFPWNRGPFESSKPAEISDLLDTPAVHCVSESS